MIERSWRYHARLGFTAACVMSLAGCSVSKPLEILPSKTRFSDASISKVYLPPEQADGPASGFRAEFAGALQRAGVQLDPQARLVAEVSLSEGSAEIGIARLPAEQLRGPQPKDWLTEPRDDGLLDECPAQRMKAVASLFDRQTGDIVFRRETVAVACAFSAADRRAAADALVADMLAYRAR